MVIVVAVLGVMLLMTLTYGMNWYRQYRFQAVAQTFANAATAVRVRSIGGMPSYYVKQIEKIGTGSTFRVHLADFTYICPRESTGSTKPLEFPVKSSTATPYKAAGDYGDDYVILSGFNSPSNVNENLFRVISVDYASLTQVSGTTDNWKVVGAKADLECVYCDPTNSADCSKSLVWDTTVTSPQPASAWTVGRELGRLRVVPCLKFIPYNTKLDLNRDLRSTADFGLNKELAGNSVQCVYNSATYDVKVRALQRKVSGSSTDALQFTPPGGYDHTYGTPPATVSVPPPVVFTFGGMTRDHLKYFVEIRRVKSDGISTMPDTQWPPAGFAVDPSGRVRMGRFDVHTEQFQ